MKIYLSSIFPEGGVLSRIYGVATRNMAQGHAGIREVYILLSFLTPAKDLGFRGACDWVSYVLNLGLLPTHPTWDCPMYLFFSTGHGSSRQETWTIPQRIFSLLQFISKYHVMHSNQVQWMSLSFGIFSLTAILKACC